MSGRGLSRQARELLIQAAENAGGLRLEGRQMKALARELEAGGWARRNKSGTRLEARPAGRFIVGMAPKAVGNKT